LETARHNPMDFAKSLKLPIDKGGFYGRSQFIRWQDAVNEYHKTNNLSDALNYIEKSFSNYANTSKNRKSYESYLISLDAYVASVKKSGNIYLKKETIKIPLNSKSMITGRVPVSFMNKKGGFSLYFFSKVSSGWNTELRFPIIQNYFSKEVYGTDLGKIAVGIFSIQDNKFFEHSYSIEEIEDAEKELGRIGRAIFSVL
jgi:hypothetical protein